MSGTSLIGSEGLNQVKAQNEEHMIKGYVRKRNLFFFLLLFLLLCLIFFFFPEKAQTQVPECPTINVKILKKNK